MLPLEVVRIEVKLESRNQCLVLIEGEACKVVAGTIVLARCLLLCSAVQMKKNISDECCGCEKESKDSL